MSETQDEPTPESPIVNLDDVAEEAHYDGSYGHAWKVLTPGMRARGGKLGMCQVRLERGQVAVPFHTHRLEDEVFYVLSGRGVLRYGDALHALRAGDCVSCPAGTGLAHQIGNPDGPEDLVYLAIGPYEPNEVCTYPDSGKVMVRALGTVGRLSSREYMEGEPGRPLLFELVDASDT